MRPENTPLSMRLRIQPQMETASVRGGLFVVVVGGGGGDLREIVIF